MIIEVKKEELPLKERRKLKLRSLDNQEIDKNQFAYGWKIRREVDDETLEDFHLFCVSIVGDLIENKFKTNENGIIFYNTSEINIDPKEIKKLYSLIKNEKYEK